jgi:hypothetical protein
MSERITRGDRVGSMMILSMRVTLVGGSSKLPGLLGQPEHRDHVLRVTLHRPYDQPPQHGFGLGYLPHAIALAQRDLLVQDFVKQGLEVLAVLLPAPWVAERAE